MGPVRDEETGGKGEGNGGRCKTCICITKWLPVLFILAVIGWSYYAFVVQLCLIAVQELWFKIFALIVYHIALLMFLWAYWQVCFTVSGKIPRKFRIPPTAMERIECATTEAEVTQVLESIVYSQQLPVQSRTNINQIRFCEKCQIIKPDRAHHCSVCGTCILKMDHHCPWVNNCVCFDNYKYFVLFLTYAFTYCVVVFLFSISYFVDFWRSGASSSPMQGKFHILFVFFVSVMFAISLVSLLGYHIFLTTRNRTTLESFRAPTFIHGPDKKGFSLGSYNNFMEVFGESKFKWFLPMFTSLGDGITYPTRHQYNTNMSLNGNYNSIDTTDSTPVSSTSPDGHQSQLVEVKVEANAGGGGDSSNGAVNELNSDRRNNQNKTHNQDSSSPQETPLVYF